MLAAALLLVLAGPGAGGAGKVFLTGKADSVAALPGPGDLGAER